MPSEQPRWHKDPAPPMVLVRHSDRMLASCLWVLHMVRRMRRALPSHPSSKSLGRLAVLLLTTVGMVTGLLPVAPGIVGQAAAAEGDGPTFEQAIVTPLPDAASWNAETVDHGDLDGDGVTDLVVAALKGGAAPDAAAQRSDTNKAT